MFPFASAVAVARAVLEVLFQYNLTDSLAWKPAPAAVMLVPGEPLAGFETNPLAWVKEFCETFLLVVPAAATEYMLLAATGALKLTATAPEKPALLVATIVPVPGPV